MKFVTAEQVIVSAIPEMPGYDLYYAGPFVIFGEEFISKNRYERGTMDPEEFARMINLELNEIYDERKQVDE